MIDLPTTTGIWDPRLRFGDEGEIREAAAEGDELGYGALWIPDTGGDIWAAIDLLHGATTGITVGTSILNLWMHPAAETAAQWNGRAEDRQPVMGIGVSHAPFVDSLLPGQYKNPMEVTATYLDELDAADPPLPAEDRLLAALRPRMLAMARDRAAGAFPYHMPPEHTARARDVLGPDSLLAVEVPLVLDTDADAARAVAREGMAIYLALPNYVNAWKWLGFTDADLADGGADRFLDAVVAHGDEDAIRQRVQAHYDAGADHVGVQVIGGDLLSACTTWRTLAPALL